MNTIALVREFHRVFGSTIKDLPDICDGKVNRLRCDLILEEFTELVEALEEQDIHKVLDALVDLQYVLDGTFLALGFAHVKHKAFLEVHRSNMSKVGEDGGPIYREDGKVLKGPNYTPPDLKPLL